MKLDFLLAISTNYDLLGLLMADEFRGGSRVLMKLIVALLGKTLKAHCCVYKCFCLLF